jgi:hypothetical protein
MNQHLPLQDPPKFTQIWIFGLKTNHLATLLGTTASKLARSVKEKFSVARKRNAPLYRRWHRAKIARDTKFSEKRFFSAKQISKTKFWPITFLKLFLSKM